MEMKKKRPEDVNIEETECVPFNFQQFFETFSNFLTNI